MDTQPDAQRRLTSNVPIDVFKQVPLWTSYTVCDSGSIASKQKIKFTHLLLNALHNLYAFHN